MHVDAASPARPSFLAIRASRGLQVIRRWVGHTTTQRKKKKDHAKEMCEKKNFAIVCLCARPQNVTVIRTDRRLRCLLPVQLLQTLRADKGISYLSNGSLLAQYYVRLTAHASSRSTRMQSKTRHCHLAFIKAEQQGLAVLGMF